MDRQRRRRPHSEGQWTPREVLSADGDELIPVRDIDDPGDYDRDAMVTMDDRQRRYLGEFLEAIDQRSGFSKVVNRSTARLWLVVAAVIAVGMFALEIYSVTHSPTITVSGSHP